MPPRAHQRSAIEAQAAQFGVGVGESRRDDAAQAGPSPNQLAGLDLLDRDPAPLALD